MGAYAHTYINVLALVHKEIMKKLYGYSICVYEMIKNGFYIHIYVNMYLVKKYQRICA